MKHVWVYDWVGASLEARDAPSATEGQGRVGGITFSVSKSVQPSRGGKSILLSGIAREHWKFSANKQENWHSDTVAVWCCQTECHAIF